MSRLNLERVWPFLIVFHKFTKIHQWCRNHGCYSRFHSARVKVITNTTDWGLKILSLKASGEKKDFIAAIKVALDCHVTDLLEM